MDSTTAIIAAVAAVSGGILGAGGVTPLVIAVLNSRRQTTVDRNDFAGATFTRMESRITALEAAERDCMESKEELLREVGKLRAMVEHMEKQLLALQR